MNLIQKLSKRNLLFLLLALLFLAVLIYSLFPKTTVASILHLDSKDQIVKIEIGKGLIPLEERFFQGGEREWQDITNTPLGTRYIDALFSTAVIERTAFADAMGFWAPDEVAAVRFTIDHLPEDYIFSRREYTLWVNLPTKSTPFEVPLTFEAQKLLQEKLNAEGKGEIAPTQEYHEFDLSHNELFTPDFINKQFE